MDLLEAMYTTLESMGGIVPLAPYSACFGSEDFLSPL